MGLMLKPFSFLLALFCFSTCHAQNREGIVASGPELSLPEALVAAEEYVRINQIDLSGQYIQSAQLAYDEGKLKQGSYWRIRWAWKLSRLGGEYGLRVYMNKQIIPEIAGP